MKKLKIYLNKSFAVKVTIPQQNLIPKSNFYLMKYILLFIFLIISLSNVFGQFTWQRTFFNSVGHAWKTQQTSDSGFITVGDCKIGVNFQIALIKQKPNGDTSWIKFIGGSENEGAFWIEETHDKGFIIGGHTDSYNLPNTTAYLIKTDSQGNIQWEKLYINAYGSDLRCVKQTTDKGYILGLFWDAEVAKTMFIKTDSLGNLIWQKLYSNNNYSSLIRQLILSDDSNYVAICNTEIVFGLAADIFVIKLNSEGDTIWTKVIGENQDDIGLSIDNGSDNGYILSGTTNSYSNGQEYKSIVIKLNENGNIQWYKIFGSIGWDQSRAIRRIPGGYIVAGSSDSLNNICSRSKLRILDLNGNLIKQYSYSPNQHCSVFYSVERAFDGGFIASGNEQNSYPPRIYIVKTDSLLYSTPIGIYNKSDYITDIFKLYQNYPNPFNGSTNIIFKLNDRSKISISVFDITGKEIFVLPWILKSVGTHTFNFNASYLNLTSGVYFYKMDINNLIKNKVYSQTKKMVYIK